MTLSGLLLTYLKMEQHIVLIPLLVDDPLWAENVEWAVNTRWMS